MRPQRRNHVHSYAPHNRTLQHLNVPPSFGSQIVGADNPGQPSHDDQYNQCTIDSVRLVLKPL